MCTSTHSDMPSLSALVGQGTGRVNASSRPSLSELVGARVQEQPSLVAVSQRHSPGNRTPRAALGSSEELQGKTESSGPESSNVSTPKCVQGARDHGFSGLSLADLAHRHSQHSVKSHASNLTGGHKEVTLPDSHTLHSLLESSEQRKQASLAEGYGKGRSTHPSPNQGPTLTSGSERTRKQPSLADLVRQKEPTQTPSSGVLCATGTSQPSLLALITGSQSMDPSSTTPTHSMSPRKDTAALLASMPPSSDHPFPKSAPVQPSNRQSGTPHTTARPLQSTASKADDFVFEPISSRGPKTEGILSLSDLVKMHAQGTAPAKSRAQLVTVGLKSTSTLSSLVASHLQINTPGPPTNAQHTSHVLPPGGESRSVSPQAKKDTRQKPSLAELISGTSISSESQPSTGLPPVGESDFSGVRSQASDSNAPSLLQLSSLHLSPSYTVQNIPKGGVVAVRGRPSQPLTLQPRKVDTCTYSNWEELTSAVTEEVNTEVNTLAVESAIHGRSIWQYGQVYMTRAQGPKCTNFTLVVGRNHRNFRKSKRGSKIHGNVLRSLAENYFRESLFDFSTPSPDDTVREKQRQGLQKGTMRKQ